MEKEFLINKHLHIQKNKRGLGGRKTREVSAKTQFTFWTKPYQRTKSQHLAFVFQKGDRGSLRVVIPTELGAAPALDPYVRSVLGLAAGLSWHRHCWVIPAPRCQRGSESAGTCSLGDPLSMPRAPNPHLFEGPSATRKHSYEASEVKEQLKQFSRHTS